MINSLEIDFGEKCFSGFQLRGADPIDVDILLPANELLDLYGEDIRFRAYVTNDPLRGELMLRPDFTVPIVQKILQINSSHGRVAYSGKVFRRPRRDSGTASEFMQVGIEDFGRENRVDADAEMLALFVETLSETEAICATGDMGILISAVDCLKTGDRRKASLLRHLWRPVRFRRLLENFARCQEPATTRSERKAAEQISSAPIGLRSVSEIEDRLAALAMDALEQPIPAQQVDALQRIMEFRGSVGDALVHLRKQQSALSGLESSVDNFENRLSEMRGLGVDLNGLSFEASFGRTTLEYYDGFVFGFFVSERIGQPPLALGGRYDHLTQAIGNRHLPAIGGVIRPAIACASRDSRS